MTTYSASRNLRREDPANNIYKFKAPPLVIGDERFALAAHTPTPGGAPIPLTDLATAINWTDASSEMTATISLTDPSDTLKLNQDQEVKLEWSPTGDTAMSELWTAKIEAPQMQLAGQTHSLTMTTALSQANKGTESYSFRRSRSHPQGWTCDQIAKYVSERTHIPIGQLAQGTHFITKLVQTKAKPLDVIIKAYRQERVATGRLFFVYWDGRLNILPLTRSQDLLLFAGAMIDAQYQEKLGPEFATAVTVRGTTKAATRVGRSGLIKRIRRTQRKLFVTVQSTAGIRLFGYVHREVTAPDAQTTAQAKRYGENLLQKVMKPERTLTVTIPIRPTLKRGDAFKVEWASQGLTQVCYVSSLSHSVAAGSATTQVTAIFTDPFEDEVAKAAAEARARVAKERGRTTAGTSAAPAGGTSSRSVRRSG